jgi:hypothetical protein
MVTCLIAEQFFLRGFVISVKIVQSRQNFAESSHHRVLVLGDREQDGLIHQHLKRKSEA